jgi:hypothetical protein
VSQTQGPEVDVFEARSLWGGLVPLLVLLAAFAAPPQAADAQDGSRAIGDTLTVITRPILSIPRITVPGGSFTIEANASASATGWSASLARGSLNYPLAVTGSTYSTGYERWYLTVGVPGNVPAEIYDLSVAASGGISDTEAHAVMVRTSIASDFYFVQITDAHLPTHKYYYESGAGTDTTEIDDLRAVIDDINIMNPAFVLFTGDIINEGELEDYLTKRYFTRTKRLLKELDVPVYMTAGNHDVGGWDSTPPADGTARRNWWKFFGWRRLYDPPPSEVAYTQDYSFDYGGAHFVGIEAYNNYDLWRRSIYGTDSFTSRQLSWLGADLATVSPGTPVVAFYHSDFQNQLNLSSLGIDCALWGHVHSSSGSVVTPPYDLSLKATCDGGRTMRVVRVSGGTTITPSLPIDTGASGQKLSLVYSPANDGTQTEVMASVVNSQTQTFEHGLVKFLVPAASMPYEVDNGEIVQTIVEGPVATCYVRVSLAASSTTSVTISPAPSGIPDATGSMLTLLAPVFPNPTRSETSISFSVASAAHVRAEILSVQGRRIAVLCDDVLAAGAHRLTWSPGGTGAREVSSGVYLYRIESGGQALTGKLVVLR